MRNLHILDRRSLENELLHPPLIARTLERMGETAPGDVVVEWLREIAETQRDRVVVELTEAELWRRNPIEPERTASPVDQIKAYLSAALEVTQAKLDTFDQVRAETEERVFGEWGEAYLALIGKRALGELSARTKRTTARVVAALAQTVREEPDFLPPGLAKIRDRLAALTEVPEAD